MRRPGLLSARRGHGRISESSQPMRGFARFAKGASMKRNLVGTVAAVTLIAAGLAPAALANNSATLAHHTGYANAGHRTSDRAGKGHGFNGRRCPPGSAGGVYCECPPHSHEHHRCQPRHGFWRWSRPSRPFRPVRASEEFWREPRRWAALPRVVTSIPGGSALRSIPTSLTVSQRRATGVRWPPRGPSRRTRRWVACW